jgi:hypothetical protein
MAAARHHFKISVDIRTFKNRRHLEMGPAAVRKTLLVNWLDLVKYECITIFIFHFLGNKPFNRCRFFSTAY